MATYEELASQARMQQPIIGMAAKNAAKEPITGGSIYGSSISPQTSNAGQIEKLIQQIGQEIDEASGALVALYSRLDPLLIPQPANPTEDASIMPCVMLGRLENLRYAVSTLRNGLLDLNSRLCL